MAVSRLHGNKRALFCQPGKKRHIQMIKAQDQRMCWRIRESVCKQFHWYRCSEAVEEAGVERRLGTVFLPLIRHIRKYVLAKQFWSYLTEGCTISQIAHSSMHHWFKATGYPAEFWGTSDWVEDHHSQSTGQPITWVASLYPRRMQH